MNRMSIQLYTVRHHLADDPTKTLEQLSRIGYRSVEPFNLVEYAPALGGLLERLDLQAPTAHARLIGHELSEVFSAAQRTGTTTVIDPYIDPKRWTTRESVEGVATDLVKVAERAVDHGLRVGYHNHAFELENRIDGVPGLEILAEMTGDRIDLEVDTYWAEVGGENAVALLERLGSRVASLHIKDGPKTTRDKDQVALGQGDMDIAAILAAAPTALAVVELDDSDSDIFNAVGESYSYLTQNNLAGETQ